jgi:hypothetical protein
VKLRLIDLFHDDSLTINLKLNMRKFYATLCIGLVGAMLSCQDQEELKNEVSSDVIAQLQAAGFDTSEGLSKYKDGYLVEYDIFISSEDLSKVQQASSISKNATEEHYRTYNLVTGTPRTLNVYMDAGFDAYMQTSFDNALARYNALGLVLSFQRASSASGADIVIQAFYENSNTLGMSAGFPDANGDPASPIQLNTRYYNGTTQRADATTVIAHEIGHAIGLRHTDYMNRKFSCGPGPFSNEGASTVGAVYIPGTPTKGETGSYMLACSNGTDRPFTVGDRTALTTVY